jgi:hypothetical protein
MPHPLRARRGAHRLPASRCHRGGGSAPEGRSRRHHARLSGHGGAAIGSQRSQKGAFGSHGLHRGGVRNGREQRARFRIIAAAFDSNRALRGGGQQHVWLQRNADITHVQPVQPGGGEQRGVHFASSQLGQSRVHIAAKQRDLEIGPHRQQLRLPARRGRADPRALRQCLQRCCTHQPVTHIGARQHGGDDEFRWADGLDILHRVNRKIDMAFKQPFIQFLGPQGLAAHFGERAIQNLVSAGGDRAERDGLCAPAMSGAQRVSHQMGLRHGKRGSARAKAQGAFGHGHSGVALLPACSRGKPHVPDPRHRIELR